LELNEEEKEDYEKAGILTTTLKVAEMREFSVSGSTV
jgi:hypothetical protein